MAAFPDASRRATVEGNPTSEENAVLAAVVASMREREDAAAERTRSDPNEMSSEEDVGSDGAESEGSSTRSLEVHRKCPICQRRFDSRYVLTERRRITATEDSTICFDREYDRVYVHSRRDTES